MTGLQRTIVALVLLVLPATAINADPWAAWRHSLATKCPQRHVEYMGDGAYDEFLAAFTQSLPKRDRRSLDRLAIDLNRCVDVAGFSCEMQSYLLAAQKLALIGRMASFGCATVKCEEDASCSRFPRVRG